MLLDIRGLTKTYRRPLHRGGAPANDGITIAVEAGEVYGLLGHNGAGKTTLVNQVVGLLRPDGGSISIDGRDAVADPGYARQACSLQPQAQLPINGLTPRQAVDLVGQLRGGAADSVRERRQRLVDALDIGEWLDADGERLSGGVKRLVSFAMAAVVPGRVVVLDEPTNDVDPVRRRLLWAAVRGLADDGAAVLLVTHNVNEAERAVDRLAILDRGRLVAEGSPAQLKAGLDQGLRLDLTLEPASAAPPAPAFATRYLVTGSHALAVVPGTQAAAAVSWALRLRVEQRIGEFALTPVSLEDLYVELLSDPVVRPAPAAASPASAAHSVRPAPASGPERLEQAIHPEQATHPELSEVPRAHAA
jgi:ABC-2 type transport system ATP-binding protein